LPFEVYSIINLLLWTYKGFSGSRPGASTYKNQKSISGIVGWAASEAAFNATPWGPNQNVGTSVPTHYAEEDVGGTYFISRIRIIYPAGTITSPAISFIPYSIDAYARAFDQMDIYEDNDYGTTAPPAETLKIQRSYASPLVSTGITYSYDVSLSDFNDSTVSQPTGLQSRGYGRAILLFGQALYSVIFKHDVTGGFEFVA
jgi:hypothetical protein